MAKEDILRTRDNELLYNCNYWVGTKVRSIFLA